MYCWLARRLDSARDVAGVLQHQATARVAHDGATWEPPALGSRRGAPSDASPRQVTAAGDVLRNLHREASRNGPAIDRERS